MGVRAEQVPGRSCDHPGTLRSYLLRTLTVKVVDEPLATLLPL